MKIQELKSLEIRKKLSAKRVHFRWHNKNNTGGNFGIDIIGINGKDYEITGRYNIEGTLRSLSFGPMFRKGAPMNVNTVEEMFEFIKKYLKEEV